MEALIFDMDGVIVDSEPIWIASKQKMLKEQGIEVADSYHHQLFGMTLNTMWTKIRSDFNLQLSVKECIARGEEIRCEMRSSVPTKSIPGAVSLIRKLNDAGMPLAIASSSSNRDIENAVDDLDIRECFKYLVSGEDCEKSKPHPDIFLKTAKKLSIEPNRILVIEDSVNGIKAAKSAGMKCIGFENPAFTKQDLSQADGIVQDLSTITISLCNSYFQ